MGQKFSILKFLVNNVCVFIVSREDGDPSMPVSSYSIIIWRLAECHSSDKFRYILHRKIIEFTCLIKLIKKHGSIFRSTNLFHPPILNSHLKETTFLVPENFAGEFRNLPISILTKTILRLGLRIPQQFPNMYMIFAVGEDVSAVVRMKMSPHHSVEGRLYLNK